MRGVRAHQLFRIITIFIFCLLSGCSDKADSEKANLLSVSACAKQLSDGSVVECEASNAPVGKYGSTILESMKIDKQFPGPKGPLALDVENDQLHRVKEIDIHGGIKLENGMLLKLAGLECDSEKVTRYLEDVFLKSSKAGLYFQLTGYELNQYKYAYIWGIYINLDTHWIVVPNEHALMAGWCKPIPQENHRFLERYRRVASLGK